MYDFHINKQFKLKGQGNLVCGNILTYNKKYDLHFVEMLSVKKTQKTKDYYDIYALLITYDFSFIYLKETVNEIFSNRHI